MQKVINNSFPGADKLRTMMEKCKYGDKMVMTAPEGVLLSSGHNDSKEDL